MDSRAARVGRCWQEERAALQKTEQVVANLEGMRLGQAAEVVRSGVAETLAYTAFPREHSTRLWTTNPFKRLDREIRGRTRVAGAFSEEEPVLVLVATGVRDSPQTP